ncbi:alpha/beta fold hydrolase [Nitratireductor aquimarinus]|uniref:alpha/beta hydrolase family protein n=1 Tax=Nitratireductor aquimarinus TaxID=889300 RepID=UPI0029361C71|nr:alpha/beta fold hydrolase [Nitratireductor aquimarinus]MDV2966315.1 alpha/beta fold hydrolase [Nitratireductor aquimarinus]
MKKLLSAFLIGMGLTGGALAQPFAGYDRLTVKADHRPSVLAASVWYPAGTPTYRGLVGDNAVFQGTSAYVGAGVAEGRFPLFVLSHGSGGNMDAISWLSSALALRGAMVLAVNHPGSTSGDSSPRRSVRLDERAADLSAVLDALFDEPAFADHVDRSRIASLGFSLGGATALNLAGLRFDPDAFADYCAWIGDGGQDCVFFSKGGVDLNALPDGFGAELRDDRIGRAIAIDPGMTYAATPESIAGTDMPVLLINLGEAHLFKAADVGPDGSDLAGKLPSAVLKTIAPAHHFTFLAECKPEGAAMLAEEKDDPVCDDPEGADRAAVHEAIVEEIAAFAGL